MIVMTAFPGSLQVPVESSMMGYIIGKGGQMIKTIESETGSRISSVKDVSEAGITRQPGILFCLAWNSNILYGCL